MQWKIIRSLPVWLAGAMLFVAACSPRVNPPADAGGSASTTSTAYPAASAPGSTAYPTVGEVFPTATQELPTVTQPPTASPPAPAQENVADFPDPRAFIWQTVVSGLERPTDLADAGEGRLLVLEQPGRVRLVLDGGLQADPFLDITDRVGAQGNEQGLLGIAFHPRFAENGFFYLDYTNRAGTTVVSRFQALADGMRADPASEKILLTIEQPYANHNGGSLAFGPDGMLYIGTGDGGSAGDPQGNGQKLTTLLGKLLRIDVDGGDPYAIPADNPFADGQRGRGEIWAYGLRNPWRFSFDRLTGDLWIADVGQNAWEEINFQPAGAPGGVNYGWNFREGAHPYRGEPPAGLSLTDPVAEYPHPEGCSVTGGFVYRGEKLPEFYGVYLYGDYCNGRVWGLLRQPDDSWQSRLLFETGTYLSSFGEDASGELYLLDQRSGSVLTLTRK